MVLLVEIKYLHVEDTNNIKSTGIVRKIDELGRVVIPVELRKDLTIKEKDSIEVFVYENQIILKKYFPYNE